MKRSRVILILSLVIFLPSCLIFKGLKMERIRFSKEQIGVDKTYKMPIPRLSRYGYEVSLTLANRGHGFKVTYQDSSKIYYSEGYALSSPNIKHYEDLEVMNKASFRGASGLDTVIAGVTSDSLFWKERILDDKKVGYLNVPKRNKEVFDRAVAHMDLSEE